VTILTPLCGDEPGLYENLRSFCEQGRRGDLQVVFGVRESSDPAIPTVQRLIREFPDCDLTLVVDGRMRGTNFKVGNLLNMLTAARHDVLVISDSDIRVGPGYLDAVVGPLQDPTVGLVTCLYVGRPEDTFWSRLGAMFVNHGFLPSVLVAERVGVSVGCFGATMALTRQTLDSVGGLAPFANLLADDYALGSAVRRAGKRVVVSPTTVDMVVVEPGPRALVSHELRWLRTVRAVEPLGYVGLVITYPLVLVVLALPFAGWSWVAWGALILTLIGRLLLVGQVDRAFSLPRSAAWWVVARDLLSFGLFAASFLGREVAWRRHRFTLRPDGALAHDGDVRR
jgi:ceramide glucosyltransferase